MREKARAAFKAYTKRFDASDIKIKLKIDHTYRVASVAERIARSLDMDEYSVDFCWLLGLLHDIGRFEQLTRYGTFKDAESVDHARLGADILFQGIDENGPLINTFIDPDEWDDPEICDFDGWKEMAGMCETVIRLHNKLALPDDLDEGTRLFASILRDADKVDIFRVLTEPPYDERNERIIKGAMVGSTGRSEVAGLAEAATSARSAVMQCVSEHRCVPKTFERTEFESLISQCCMAFELEYDASREIVRQQGYLDALMNLPVEDGRMAEQLGILRDEMRKAWESADKKDVYE